MDYDEWYRAVEFSFATAAVCLAVAAFEATPIGWAALGIGIIA